MFDLYWYPLQCCYSPKQFLLYLLHCYSLVVVAVVVAVVVVVVVAAVVVIVSVVVVAAAAVVDFVWQFCRYHDCKSSVVAYLASLAAVILTTWTLCQPLDSTL